MSLNSIIRSGVAIADSITTDLQAEITHAAWINQDGMGAPVYGRRVSGLDIYGDPDTPGVASVHKCVVELKERIREVNGRQIVTFAHLTFPRQIPPNGMTAFRKDPFDPRDVIVLPDGKTGPIVDTSGVWDAETGMWYAVEVWLGDTLRIGGQ